MTKSNIIYAPLINTGGGKKLLFDILTSLKDKEALVFLDDRIRGEVNFKLKIIYVKNNLLGFLIGEIKLYLNSSLSTKVLCFHGAPPLIKNPGYVYVFFQNRLYLTENRIFNIAGWLKKYFFTNSFSFCQKIIVQTQTMKSELIKSTKLESLSEKIDVLPFGDFCINDKKFVKEKKYDFIYVADSYPHKNHKNLFLAWAILAKNGIFPSLALTIPKAETSSIFLLNKFIFKYKLNIKNLYTIDQKSLIQNYLMSRALIYPSFSESFGLPLIEASFLKIPIVASELDFVRDVCNPVETFNPNSPLSISRAVERFLKTPIKISPIFTTHQFIKKIFNEHP